jgi:DedD protein
LALVLAAIIGLPMLLDSEPKPLADDITIQIPSKDKSLPLPAPSERAKPRSVSALDSTDGGEEIIPAPSASPSSSEIKNKPKNPELNSTSPVKNMSAVATLTAPKKEQGTSSSSEVKTVGVRPEIKPETKPDNSAAAKQNAVQTAASPAKTAAKPSHAEVAVNTNKAEVKTDSADEAARALAILEAKPVNKSAVKTESSNNADSHYVVQVAALATTEKVAELQAKLNAGGIKSYTQKVATTSGEKIRVRVGPFASKEEAEKARTKLSKLGLGGTLIPN